VSLTEKEFDGYTVCVDGGICSQIAFVAFGMDLAERGFRIRYDLSWYDRWGKDAQGRQSRKWLFEEAFPNLPLSIVRNIDLERVETIICDARTDIRSLRPPLRLAGYPPREASVDKMLGVLRRSFGPVMSDASNAVLRLMSAEKSCAVHVRRGDLGGPTVTSYGLPCGFSYFDRAMRMADALLPGFRCFFFSDEPDWVRNELLPRLPFGQRSKVVDVNGADGGHEDLFLMAQADCIIASHGTAGSYAALLSHKEPLLITPTRRNELYRRRPNVIYVNEDVGVQPREVLSDGAAALTGPSDRKKGGWRAMLFRKRS